MKKIIFLISFLISMQISAQNTVVYAILQPVDMGIGTKVDFDHIYSSISWGNFYLPDEGYLKDHIKITVGGIYKDYHLGLSYHSYGDINVSPLMNEKKAITPISFEFGARVRIYKRGMFSLSFDPIIWTGIIGIGIIL